MRFTNMESPNSVKKLPEKTSGSFCFTVRFRLGDQSSSLSGSGVMTG